jgi:membrane protease YdiL (CAAX protease family)
MRSTLITLALWLTALQTIRSLPLLPEQAEEVFSIVAVVGFLLLLILGFRWIEAAKRQKPLPRAKRVARGFEVVQ